jgi:hypothetical protein
MARQAWFNADHGGWMMAEYTRRVRQDGMVEIIASGGDCSFVQCVFDPFTIDPVALEKKRQPLELLIAKKSCKGTA